jgi:hypothetical protein
MFARGGSALSGAVQANENLFGWLIPFFTLHRGAVSDLSGVDADLRERVVHVGVRAARRRHDRLWVPETVSPYATWEYSWIRPPSRSRRRTRTFAPDAGGRGRPEGGLCCSARCAWCAL